jgi:hypothetical protein
VLLLPPCFCSCQFSVVASSMFLLLPVQCCGFLMFCSCQFSVVASSMFQLLR